MLRILTLSINYYGEKHGDWTRRRELIRLAIAEVDADVVALQAVRRDPALEGGLDQATQLSRLLPGYEYVIYQPAESFAAGVAQGSVMVTRLEVAETDYLDLTLRSGLEDTNRRVHARTLRIDYSWANRHLAAQVASAETVAGEREGARLSDHLGLAVALALDTGRHGSLPITVRAGRFAPRSHSKSRGLQMTPWLISSASPTDRRCARRIDHRSRWL